MHRRHFVAGLGTAGVGLTTASGTRAQSTRTLNIGSIFGTGDASRAAIGQDLAQRVSVLSGGALTLDISTIDAGAAAETLSGGALDGLIGSQDLFVPLSPAFGLFSSVPGGMMERELEAFIRADRGQQRWDALSAEHDLKSLLLGDTGAEMLWSTTALDDAATLAGVQIATRGLAAQAWTAAGAEVTVPANMQPFATAAQAFETGPLADQYTARDTAPALLYLDTPTRPSSTVSLTFGRATWDGLSEDERRVIEAASTAITFRTNSRAMQANALAHQALRLASGVTIQPLPQPAWDTLMEASRTVFDEMESLEGEGRTAWRAYTRFARDVQNWTRLSEAAFTTARARNVPA